MAEDTAVLEPVTAEAPEPTPPPDEAPETEALVFSPETEGSEGTPETDEANPWEGKPAAEIDKHVEAEVAKARESERRKYEAKEQEREQELRKAVFQQKLSRAAELRQGGFARALADATQRAAEKTLSDGEVVRIHPDWLTSQAAAIESSIATEQYQFLVEFQDSLLAKDFPDYRPSQEVSRALDAARVENDAEKLHTARYAQLREAVRESLRAEVRKEIEAEMKAEADKNGRLKGAQDGAAARAGGPTVVNGNVAGVTIRSMEDADRAWNADLITTEQYRAARERFLR